MKPSTSPNNTARPAKRLWIWLAALVAAGLAVAFLYPREKHKPGAQGATASASPRGYRNRAIQRPSGPKEQAPAEQPTISGNVYGIGGELIQGATVVAMTYDIAGNVPTIAATTKSDERGRFELSLPQGTYQLNASMAGYGPSFSLAQSGDVISLVLPKSGVLKGHVRDERGEPVKSFTIDLVAPVPGDAPALPPLWSRRFESPDGSFRVDQLPVWSVIVRATSDDFAPAFSPDVLVGAKDEREVNLTLPRGCALGGRVEDKRGKPLGHVFVDAEQQMAGGAMTSPSLQTDSQTESDDDGNFHFEHVPTGTIVVRGYDGAHAVAMVTVEVRDCESAPNVKVVMSAGGSVTGVARAADGTPLAGGRVTLTDRSIGFINVGTDAEGRFRFDDLPAGSPLRIELEHQGRRSLNWVMPKEGETVNQDMTLFGGGNGELRGRVTAGGKPLAGMRLAAIANRGQTAGIDMYFPVTGADGTFRVPSILAGAYLVSVMASAEGRGVQIKADEVTTVDFDVATVHEQRAPRAAKQ